MAIYYDPNKYEMINQIGFSGQIVPIGSTSSGSGGVSTPLPVPADQVGTVTGIDPAAVAAATFGKIIPIWVGGMPRMGGHIIFGPNQRIVDNVIRVDFGISFGMPANNLGIREIRELRLDGFKVWTVADGYIYPGFTFRFYGGTETQAVDPLVTAAYPTAGVAHKGQCLVYIEDLALTDFDNKIPFVSALIADITGAVDPTDGVLLGDALEQIAASPYVNIDFEAVDISERVDAVIIAEKIAFIDLLVRYSRLHLWDVVQRDKLKIIERGTVTPDLSLDLSHIVPAGGDEPPIMINRQQQDDIARELQYSFIDIDRDYEINTVTAKRQSAPVAVTVSAGVDTIALPSVHTSHEGLSWVTLRLFKDELARERATFTTGIYGFEIEPGDIVSVDAVFKTYTMRVLDTLHGANWTNRITAEPILRCAIPISAAPLDGLACLTGAWSLSRRLKSSYLGAFYTAVSGSVSRIWDQTGNARHFNAAAGGATIDPYWNNVVLLVGAEGSNGSTTFPDESSWAQGNAPIVAGNAQVTTTDPLTATSSLLLDGTGDYIAWVPTGGAFGNKLSLAYPSTNLGGVTDYNNALWTVDLQWKPTQAGIVLGSSWTGVGQASWFLQAIGDGSFRFFSFDGSAGFDFTTATGLWTTGATYRLRMDSDGIKARLYLNGSMIGSATPPSGFIALIDSNAVGATRFGLGISGFAGVGGGRWDELRVTNGVCRTGSDGGYAPETLPFPRG